jgi:hypothetical protein
MAYKRKTKQPYSLITPAVIARYKTLKAKLGSGAAAVRTMEPEQTDEYRRAWLIEHKSRQLDAGEYIDNRMQRSAIRAIERVGELVESPDERIAIKASMFLIDHVRGKALQRSESKHLNLNIQSVLE